MLLFVLSLPKRERNKRPTISLSGTRRARICGQIPLPEEVAEVAVLCRGWHMYGRLPMSVRVSISTMHVSMLGNLTISPMYIRRARKHHQSITTLDGTRWRWNGAYSVKSRTFLRSDGKTIESTPYSFERSGLLHTDTLIQLAQIAKSLTLERVEYPSPSKKRAPICCRGKKNCVIWESNPGLPDAARMATENFTTKPITLLTCCIHERILLKEATRSEHAVTPPGS